MSDTTPPTLHQPRRVEQLVTGQHTSDGAGVKLTRVLGGPALQRRLDPFLMLDAFGSDKADDYIAGFPDHPHRGFETITYMIAGRMRHRDSAGHEGLLTNGSVQWMTAGRGLVHSELPEQEEGLMEGFQIWLNLPSQDKLCPPWYRDIASDDIPEFLGDGVCVRVISGSSHGVPGVVQRAHTEPVILDIHLDAGQRFDQPLPAGHNALVYIYRGEASVGDAEADTVSAGRMAILANDPQADGVRLQTGPTPAKVLLIAGRPLNEPIVQYGPFVMNTREELHQAIEDFNAGRMR